MGIARTHHEWDAREGLPKEASLPLDARLSTTFAGAALVIWPLPPVRMHPLERDDQQYDRHCCAHAEQAPQPQEHCMLVPQFRNVTIYGDSHFYSSYLMGDFIDGKIDPPRALERCMEHRAGTLLDTDRARAHLHCGHMLTGIALWYGRYDRVFRWLALCLPKGQRGVCSLSQPWAKDWVAAKEEHVKSRPDLALRRKDRRPDAFTDTQRARRSHIQLRSTPLPAWGARRHAKLREPRAAFSQRIAAEIRRSAHGSGVCGYQVCATDGIVKRTSKRGFSQGCPLVDTSSFDNSLDDLARRRTCRPSGT